MKQQLFNTTDLFIVPFVILLLTGILFFIRRSQAQDTKKYFFPSFFLRVFGSFTIAFVYQFVYGYGDTFAYYSNAQALTSFLSRGVGVFADILLSDPAGDSQNVAEYMDLIGTYNELHPIIFSSAENANVSKIASVFNIVCFNSYIGMALFFGTLSFLGCWYIFKTFIRIFPGYEKYFAWFCLYLPSLWFWGNGILKDPICIFGLGILLYGTFIKSNSFLKRLLFVLTGAALLISIKSYIFYAFSAALILGWMMQIFRKVNIITKLFLSLLVLSGMGFMLYIFSADIAEAFASIITKSSQFAESYSAYATEGDGSLIPKFDSSPAGFLKLSAEGLMNVYMRPFPWDVRKVLYLFLILENLLLYYILFKKIQPAAQELNSNSPVLVTFCFVFIVFLGIIIGVTSFNLGTIARYRVPALPFLFAGVFCLRVSIKKRKQSRLQATTNQAFLPTA